MPEVVGTASEGAVRIDVWLWRARFFRSRASAALAVTQGRLRLSRRGFVDRIDKPSRAVRPGDELVFAIAGRLRAIRIEALGARRGPSAEARRLYATLEDSRMEPPDLAALRARH